MTNDEYRYYVSYVRYFTSEKVVSYVNRRAAGSKLSLELEQDMKMCTLYLQMLERYHLPIVVVGTTAEGGTTIVLKDNIDLLETIYGDNVNHIITGTGIPDGTTVVKITSSLLELSNTISEASTEGQFQIGTNEFTPTEMIGIADHLNQIQKTSFTPDFIFTEFDLESEAAAASDSPLLYGNDASTLVGADIYDALIKDETFIGADTAIVFNFSEEYPYFAYPATFDDLVSILDQNGDDLIAAGTFTQSVVSVTGPAEWAGTKSYKVYSMGWKTTIPGYTFTFNFS